MLFFVRHGQSEANKIRVYGGHTHTPLTDIGKEQARKTGLKLSQDGIQITRIISSDLARALETAEIIRDVLGISVEIETTPVLRESCAGEFDGKAIEEGKSIFQKSIESEEGESLTELKNRAIHSKKLLESIPTNENVLIVGHNSFFALIFAIIEGHEDIIEYRKNWNMENGSIKTLEFIEK